MSNTKSSIVKSIDKVVVNARQKYNEIMESEHVGKDIRIDGKPTRGQIEENTRKTNVKEECTRTVTCMLDVVVKRGSLVEVKDNSEQDYSYSGIVTSIPNVTPVDYYFQVLLFNTVVRRYRKSLIYSEDGYIIGDNPLVEDNIPCFVQRVGKRERQIDIGIDSDSVNEIIASKHWDIQKGDILYVGSEKYKMTDIKELDSDILWGYMTYYRE